MSRASMAWLAAVIARLEFGASLHGARVFGIVGYLGRTARNWDEALEDLVRDHSWVRQMVFPWP